MKKTETIKSTLHGWIREIQQRMQTRAVEEVSYKMDKVLKIS
jgi:hypothetical protein